MENKQVTGNVGLFYTCYQLSLLGWNVMPTSRNARGIDILIYSHDAKKKHTIQVKTRSEVPSTVSLDAGVCADFVVIVNLSSESPESFILKKFHVKKLARLQSEGEKKKMCLVLARRRYANKRFREKWKQHIGKGGPPFRPAGAPVSVKKAVNVHTLKQNVTAGQVATDPAGRLS
jgi:hypothetical protein